MLPPVHLLTIPRVMQVVHVSPLGKLPLAVAQLFRLLSGNLL